jgi:hypothetical protein
MAGVHNLSGFSPLLPDLDAANNKRYIMERVQLQYIRGRLRRGFGVKIMSKKVKAKNILPKPSTILCRHQSSWQTHYARCRNLAVSTLIVKVKVILRTFCLSVV